VKVDNFYNWVLDSREGRNEVFMGYAKKQNELAVLAGKKPNWRVGRLTLSHFVHLVEGVKDLDCADMSNENADGMVTFKSFGDLIGSTTGDNSHHFEEEVIKMYATGIPACLVIWGSRFAYQSTSNVTDELILSGLQKCATIQAAYKIPAIWVENAGEAIECGKSFIRHCNELPRRLPVYCLIKREGEVAVLVGYELIGEKTARLILAAWRSLVHLFKFIIDYMDTNTEDEIAQGMKDYTPGLRIDQAKSVVVTTLKNRGVLA